MNYITDIKAGLVDTAMSKGEGLFWVAQPEKAALQIYKAIKGFSHGDCNWYYLL